MKKNEEKNLVIEQKGWRVLFLGLVLAGLFGLTFRALFSPRRIQYEIERALKSNDFHLVTSVSGARLSLSEGLWPQLAIIVDELQLSSKDPCLYQPVARVNHLVLPVDLSSLWDRTLSFKKIAVDELDLQLTLQSKTPSDGSTNGSANGSANAPSNGSASSPSSASETGSTNPGLKSETCGTVASTVASSVANEAPASSPKSPETPKTPDLPASAAAPTQGVAGVKNLPVAVERPPLVQTVSLESTFLRHIEIKRARLKLDKWSQFTFDFENLDVSLPASENERFMAQGLLKINLSTEEQNRGQQLQGLNLNFSLESTKALAHLDLEGAWREGQIQMKGEGYPQKQAFKWEGSFKQVPLSQLIVAMPGLFDRAGVSRSSGSWVSGEIHWDHQIDSTNLNLLSDRWTFTNGRIEGELGDFIIGTVRSQKKMGSDNWDVEPYHVLVKNVNLELLSQNLIWKKTPFFFGEMGFFNGDLFFNNDGQKSVSGEWTDFGLTFNSGARREIQKVKKTSVYFKEKEGLWRGDLTKIEFDQGVWKGQVGLFMDPAKKIIEVESEFDELIFNPDVQSFLLRGGHTSPLEGRFHFTLEEGKPTQLNGFIKAEKIALDQVSIENARLDMESQKDFVTGSMKIMKVNWPQPPKELWPHSTSLSDGRKDKEKNKETESDGDGERALRAKSLSLDFSIHDRDFELKSMKGWLSSPPGSFELNFSWDKTNAVKGRLHVREDGKKFQYLLTGSRRSPMWDRQ